MRQRGSGLRAAGSGLAQLRGLPWLRTAAVVLAMALVGVLAGAVLLRPSQGESAERGSAYRPGGSALVARPDGVPAGSVAELAKGIAEAQARVTRVPSDWVTWAELGLAYVQQARLTADPAYYPKAEGALRQSLKVHEYGNFLARTGQGALAAARHDFAAALEHGQRALAINEYSAPAQGVVVDALIELGRYDEAWTAVQRLVDLVPDTGALARGSYAAELRGDPERARELLSDALRIATGSADAGFALYYLGELAWNAGDVAGAAAKYEEGLRRAPDYLPLLAGRAKVAAAQGRYAAAVETYRTLVARQPQPGYLIEYGDLLAAHGDTAGAAAQYAVVRAQERLLAAQGVNVDVELALFDADHGQAAQAVVAARREYAARRSVHTEDALAWALHAAGRNAEALPHAKAALRLGTRSAQFRYHLGMIEAALGDAGAARRDLTEALRLNPHFSPLHAPRARAALTRLGGAR